MCVPNRYHSGDIAGEKKVAIGTELHLINIRKFCLVDCDQRLPVAGAPDHQSLVAAGGGDFRSISTERDATQGPFEIRNLEEPTAIQDIPDIQLFVLSSARDALSIGVKRDCPDVTRMAIK